MSVVEKNVLVIYTGGTIGMIADSTGAYRPHKNLLGDILSCQSRFDDPMANSIFSNLNNKQAYALWFDQEKPTQKQASIKEHRRTLTVKAHQEFHGSHFNGELYEGEIPALQTPKTFLSGVEHTVKYAILEYDPLLDSSDVSPKEWVKIVRDIELNYNSNFDGFVILHGTDTMAYTASALSFMLEGLDKTILLTGSQIPLTHIRADASDNILHSLLIAGTITIPEVTIYFNHQLLRGNRATKVSTSEFDAFRSYNYPPLAKVGTKLDVNWNVVLPKSNKPFTVHKSSNEMSALSPEICVLRFFPGIKMHVIEAIVEDLINHERAALILQTFGSGNIGRNDKLLDLFKKASNKGVVIVNTSQCHTGSVSGAYENGRVLGEAGVVFGNDLTCEAALTKLSYLLSTDLSTEEIRKIVPVSLRGEVNKLV
ncbi:hypothetical protein E3Q24_04168 [Wallemia mellicola]|nr:hypothetical protein E3Q24_04168 [Wallemia mellicola]TIC19560.1 Asparaginase/glutaminase [Wallemia mellicola]